MPATTYAISVNEETARRFEAAAANVGMEPSEVLCRLVREFANAGGFEGGAAVASTDDADALKQQASEWLALRAAHELQQQVDARGAATPAGSGDEAEAAGNFASAYANRDPLPWEDPTLPALPWQQDVPKPKPKLPWED